MAFAKINNILSMYTLVDASKSVKRVTDIVSNYLYLSMLKIIKWWLNS